MRIPRTSLSLVITVGFVALGCGASKSVGGDNPTNCLDNCTDGGDDGNPTFDISGDNPSGETPVFQDIDLTPISATVIIDTGPTPPVAGTVSYTGKLNLSGGGTKDVTSELVMTLDDASLGSFKGTTFTSVTSIGPAGTVTGKTTTVHGTAETKTGNAKLTVVQLRKTGDHKDFFFIVPWLAPPSPDHDVLKFGTNIKQVDVAFVQDTTGSMGGSIDGVKSTITTTIIPGIVAAIPSVGIGVVDHKDEDDTWDTKVLNVVNTDPAVSSASYSGMSAGGGGDEPESQEIGMYHSLTGEAFSVPPPVPKHTPAPGTFGGVDFRPGSLPIVVNITDAHYHDDIDIPWTTGSYMDLNRLIKAFKAANAKFIGIEDQHYASSETTPYPFDHQPQLLSDATSSNIAASAFGGKCGAGQCCSNQGGTARAPDGPGGSCRLVFNIMDGVGIDASLVTAIQAISVGSVFDVTAVPSNDPTNAKDSGGVPVDATKFIDKLRAMDEGSPAQGCPAHAAKDVGGKGYKDTFISVVVGTPVCFEIVPKMNTTVKPTGNAQFFNAFVDVLGMPGSVKLDRRVVLFEVPPSEIIPK